MNDFHGYKIGKAIAIALLLCAPSQAQQGEALRFGLAASGEINTYLFSFNRIQAPFKYGTTANFSIGGIVRYKISRKSELGVDIFFNTKNHTMVIDWRQYKFSDPNDPLSTAQATQRVSSYYGFVDVITDYRYDLDSNGIFYLDAGVVNSFMVADRIGQSATSAQSGKLYKDYLLSTKLGIGFKFSVGKHLLYVEPQTRIDLTDVHTTGTHGNPTHWGVEAGFLF